MIITDTSIGSVWVFGYGSLVWRPGFDFIDTKVGFIKHYSRRFWQGNDVHRGSPSKLGRVVTLVEKQGAITWGRAFLLKDVHSARMYLDHRETSLGGYSTLSMDFYTEQDGGADAIKVLVYVALPSNPQYLGPAPLTQIASDIVAAEGCNGHNVEYLAKLSAFMRLHAPSHHEDSHLQSLDENVRQVLKEMNAQHLLKYFDEALKSFPRFELSIMDSTRLPDETWNQKVGHDRDRGNELTTKDSECKSLTYFNFHQKLLR